MALTDPKQPAAQRDGDRPSLQGDYYTGGGKALQQREGEDVSAEDDRDTHEPGWTDGRADGEPEGTTRAGGETTARSADVAKTR